jgi:hypothetical protein
MEEQAIFDADLEEVAKKADPELLHQLSRVKAGAANERTPTTVEAVFVLDNPEAHQPMQEPSPRSKRARAPDKTTPVVQDDVEAAVNRLIDRVEARTGKRVQNLNVFRYLNSFIVAAEPSVIKFLLKQPEVASAVANRQPGKVELLE